MDMLFPAVVQGGEILTSCIGEGRDEKKLGDPKKVSSRPITNYPPGSVVRISQLTGGRTARTRLCAMGLTPGTLVTVDSSGSGPCRLKVRESDLVLGAGLASSIHAEEIQRESACPRGSTCPRESA
jgi:ferrous iron transport protein A